MAFEAQLTLFSLCLFPLYDYLIRFPSIYKAFLRQEFTGGFDKRILSIAGRNRYSFEQIVK